MTHHLADNSYGKADVRLLVVDRREPTHAVRDLSVTVTLHGDFDRAYTAGDNGPILSTDAIKNTVYALAREHARDHYLEHFADAIAARLLDVVTAARQVAVEISEATWDRVAVSGQSAPHAFQAGAGERRLAGVRRQRDGGSAFWGGLDNVRLLKTTGSAFGGFLRDEFSTMADISDRVFAPVLSIRWDWLSRDAAFGPACARVRTAVIETFTLHDDSRSAQHTLYFMGCAVLAAVPEADNVDIRWPGRLHQLIDLAPFGQQNHGEVYVPVDQTPGFAQGRVTRADRLPPANPR